VSELSHKPALKYDIIIQSCLIFILIFTPLAFGAKRLWAITPVYLATLTALVALCLRINSEGAASFRWTALGAPILLFLAIAITSSFISAYPHGSVMALYRVITYIAIFYLVVNGIDTKERMARLVGVIVGMGALLSLIGIVLYLGHSYYRYWLPGSTLSATFINRDHFAGYLEMVIPLAAAFLFTDMEKEKKVLVGFFLVMMIIAFVLAASRGAWVSLVMSSCVLVPFLFRKRLLKRMLLAMIICGAVTYFALSHFDLSVASARAKTIIEGAGIDELRIQMWTGSIELIKARPLLGWGIGSFIYVFPQFQPIAISQRYIIDYAHNDYLHMAAEIGLAGLFFMLWIMVGALWFGLKEFWQSGGTFKRSILLGASIGVMSMSLHSFVDFNLHIPANAILFVTLIGIIMAMRGRRRYE
jgi:O-antigen ligase